MLNLRLPQVVPTFGLVLWHSGCIWIIGVFTSYWRIADKSRPENEPWRRMLWIATMKTAATRVIRGGCLPDWLNSSACCSWPVQRQILKEVMQLQLKARKPKFCTYAIRQSCNTKHMIESFTVFHGIIWHWYGVWQCFFGPMRCFSTLLLQWTDLLLSTYHIT